MKKGVLIFATFVLFTLVFLSTFVSAQIFEELSRSIGQAASYLLGNINPVGNASPNEVLFIKILVFILLFAMISVILGKIPTFGDNKGIQLLIGFIVSLISIRFITNANLINFIWLPYGVLGIVLSVCLPFVIGFFFIEDFDSPIIRKVGWSAYLVIFAGLGIMRWNDLSSGSQWYQNLAWMYIIIAFLSGILLLFDGSIRTAMFMGSLRGVHDVNKRAEAAKITAEIEKDRETLALTTDSKSRSALQKRIKERKRAIKAILKS